MLFNSTVFLLFFAVFFAVYWRLRRRFRLQNVLILSASLFFYGWWDERFLVLIALSSSIDFVAAIGASGERVTREDKAKAALFLASVALVAVLPTIADSWVWLAATLVAIAVGGACFFLIERFAGDRRHAYILTSVISNLGILATFKYFGFFTESFVAVAQGVGFEVNAPMMQIVLPIGISFYTFQTLSYTIDVWRGEMRPSRSIVNFAAYVCFFPQLVAGPIERAKALLPQFEVRRVFDRRQAFDGALLFLWGLYKKTAIADNLAPIVNAAFAAPAETAPELMLLGVLGFAVQIYCDFSGYSDMARGLAKMLGFELMLNFDLPYFSRTPSEFWRRWHISLSSWLRDYLYVPLGGNRGGRIKTYRNLFATMLLGGLWHGAAWTFVAWGAFHGGILAIYRAFGVDAALARAEGAARIVANFSAWAVMSALTLVGWTLFRAESIADAGAALARMTSLDALTKLSDLPEAASVTSLVAPLIIANIGHRFFPETFKQIGDETRNAGALPFMLRANAVILLVCSVAFLSAEGQQQFIYFDF
jgi:D-alanyl-lipoteichoic acid acyltransferase DltB (MBOAT superfamily)